MNIHYFWWIPAVILFNIGYAWFSHKNNISNDNMWVLWTWLYGILAPWFIVSKVSKDIVFDAFLYDTIIMTTFAVAIICITGVNDFTLTRWIGAGLVVVGLVMMKL